MNKFKLLVAPLLVLPFVVGCNNGGGQDPVVYHTLKFVSETCYMKDDIGGQVSEKQFEAGETANFHLDPHEGYLLPLENQVDFKDTKTGEDFTGTYSYDPSNGNISVKMTADVTIYAGNSEDPYYVNEQEFKDALSFKDVQYLQVDGQEGEDFDPFSYCKKWMSPTVYHNLQDVNPVNITNGDSYEDEYCRKNSDGTYNRCYKHPLSPSDPYILQEFTNAEDCFITPQTYLPIFDTSFLGALEYLRLSYNSFNYIDFEEQRIYKVEFSDIPYVGSGDIIFRFENKKLVYFELTTNDGMALYLSYTYNQETPEFPIVINEVQIPTIAKASELTLQAKDGSIYIKIADTPSAFKTGSVLHAAYCNLYDESSIDITTTPKVFSIVKADLGGDPVGIQYNVESIEEPTVVRAEEWNINFSSDPTGSNLCLSITINNDFESTETGRTTKQNYTGDVDCLLTNVDNGDGTNTVKFNISYDSITEELSHNF